MHFNEININNLSKKKEGRRRHNIQCSKNNRMEVSEDIHADKVWT